MVFSRIKKCIPMINFNTEGCNKFFIFLSYFLTLIIVMIVYNTGGTAMVYTNLIYIPIAIISSSSGKKQGVIHGIISGFLMGPFMPLDVEMGINQLPINWITRLIIYTFIAFTMGFFSDNIRNQKNYLTNILTSDSLTHFKNIESIKKESNFRNKNTTFIALSIKDYNEVINFFGYNFNNDMIFEFSKLLENVYMDFDNVKLYRYHGMEFLIRIEHEEGKITKSDAIRLLDSINKTTLIVNNIPIYLEIRLGITTISENISIFEGVRFARSALKYSLKENLKYKVYDQEDELQYMDTVSIAANFSDAIKSHNIKVAYQEIYNARDDSIYGVELLSRWFKDENSQIPPSKFIPIIENSELINDLNKFVIDQSIEILSNVPLDNKMISINFSVKNLNEENIDYLIQRIEANNLSPSQYQIEVTEDIFINSDTVVNCLRRAKNYGMKIAIDDFGSGYSSYKYFDTLPIDVIKIDKALIMKMNKSQRTIRIVKSIVNLCKENGIITIAEGVESKLIAQKCKEIGIDLMQGFYYHKPEIANIVS